MVKKPSRQSSANIVDENIRKINQIVDKLNKFSDFLESFDESKISIFNLKARLARAEKLLEELETLLIDIDSDFNISEFEDQYYECVSKANEIISNFDSKPSIPSNNLPVTNVILPQPNFPSFDGDYARWNEFYDNFKTLIDNNCNFSNVQKLSFLKGCLRGAALDLISSLPNSPENYEIALDLLTKKYNNKRKILYNYVNSFFELKPVQKDNFVQLSSLINSFQRNYNCLVANSSDADILNLFLCHLVTSKLDHQTIKEWEGKLSNTCSTDSVPSAKDLISFLQIKCNTLESIQYHSSSGSHQSFNNTFPQKTKHMLKSNVSTISSCHFCSQSHYLYSCDMFLKLDIPQRIIEVKKLHLCLNCLRKGHDYSKCKSNFKCKICKKPHNTLLHLVKETQPIANQNINTQQPQTQASSSILHNSDTTLSSESVQPLQSSTHCGLSILNNSNHDLLSTAIINLFDCHGNSHSFRALLDSGSQQNYISHRLVQLLNLKTFSLRAGASCLAEQSIKINHGCEVTVTSSYSCFSATIACLVVPKVVGIIPQVKLSRDNLNIPQNLTLADPNFDIPGETDIIIGSSIFWEILLPNKISLGTNKPVLFESSFGWIVAGLVQLTRSGILDYKAKSLFSMNTLHEDVARFWEVDEFLKPKKYLTEEEQFCEQHFLSNISQTSSGRYIVKLPVNSKIQQLGQSFDTAYKRFLSLEKRFLHNESFKQSYIAFLREYEFLGHMTEFDYNNDNQAFFLPHHGVIRESSTTTKLRVVFDGSCKTSTGISINDTQLVGPTVQSDIFKILTNFRFHKYVLTADIKQMYRQVLVHEDDRKYQCILFRENPNDNLKFYKLNTITYGTASAPYLATRCLKYLADSLTPTDQKLSKIIDTCFYVDDLLTGFDTLGELNDMKQRLISSLNSVGFYLTKFRSNADPLNNNESSLVDSYNGKVLGICWDSLNDIIHYNINITDINTITKRNILSATSQLFDPLGLIAPIIVIPKLIIQSLWQLSLDWDDIVPDTVKEQWTKFMSELSHVSKIKIQRHAMLHESVSNELHVFADASSTAYGACAYLRSVNSIGQIQVSLLSAKSRVAPIKKATIPRLELCAAVLASQLADKLKHEISVDKTICWTDSTIVLSWLQKSPGVWPTYVANRVAEIQRLTKTHDWHHIDTNLNPADIVSRGCYPSDLLNSNLWWSGPSFLSSEYVIQNHSQFIPSDTTLDTTFNMAVANKTRDIFDKYSSLTKLVRVTCLCKRFMFNTRHATNKIVGPIQAEEYNNALNDLIKLAQVDIYSSEIKSLMSKGHVPSNSTIYQLSPFIENGILRVGGRLCNSNLNFNQKHQIILPPHHSLTKLIVENEHVRTLHSGPLAMLNSLRQRFWPIKAKNIIKKVYHDCVICFKAKPKICIPKMGNLPSPRVTISYPFYNTGVDFGGPFQIKENSRRNCKVIKCYIAIFICLNTKAIHLELVSSLSTPCFIASLKRFISRRGLPKSITSDNATNFVGAANELYKLQTLLSSNEDIFRFTASQGITWKFIPPRAPNFGGVWEAGIGSVKSHLKRILQSSVISFEGFYTILTQIEAILNSRPISPMSDCCHDLNPLTPAHFLIGRNITAVPEEDVTDIRENRLSQFQAYQKIVQSFWKRWSMEYLHTLQQRQKWNRNNTSARIGQLALIKEDNLPPSLWKLGRIIKVHPGSDQVVRVVTLRVQTGEITRSTSKIAILPQQEDSNTVASPLPTGAECLTNI